MARFEPYPRTVGAELPSPCMYGVSQAFLVNAIRCKYPRQTLKNHLDKKRVRMLGLLFQNVFVH